MLLDSAVTKQGIDAAFRSLKSKVAANDVFVLFVAGHGRNSASTYYFLPQDITFKDGRRMSRPMASARICGRRG